jgi:hypothetical protein
MDEYKSLSHTAWECKYHVVFIPKCRRKTLYGQLRQYLGEVFELLSILVYELNSSGDLVSLFHLFSIDERNTVNDLGEVREAA